MGKTKSPVTPNMNVPKEPRIKYVKKAGMWVKTWFEIDRTGKAIQKQEWSVDEPKV